MTDLDWHHQAACKDLPVLLFFPPEGERQAERDNREARAKAVCNTCPVRMRCLEEALERNDKHGIWGGLNPDERVPIRRRLQRTGALSLVARPRPRVTVTEKQCCRCQETLSADLFYTDNRATDGLTSACKGCQHAGERQGRREAREAAAS